MLNVALKARHVTRLFFTLHFELIIQIQVIFDLKYV